MPADFKLTDVLHEAFGPHLPDADGPHEILIEFAADKAAYVTSRTWRPLDQRIACAAWVEARRCLRSRAAGIRSAPGHAMQALQVGEARRRS